MKTLFLSRWLPVAMLLAAIPSVLAQGELTPGGPPAKSMKTLDQIEARTPIDAINTPGGGNSVFEITQSGSYYLTANLDVPAGKTTGIRIEEGVRGGVTIDLNGFTIAGASEAAIGVGPGVAGVVIRNGHIRDGAKHAILGEEASEMTFEDLLVVNCGAGTNSETIFGANRTVLRNVQVRDCGLGIQAGSSSEVVGCTVENAGDHGISVASHSRVESCNVRNAGRRGIDLGSGCVVRNNNVSDNDTDGTGIGSGGSQSVVEGNRVSGFAVGLQFTGDRNRIVGNTVEGNTDNYEFVEGNELNLLLSEIPESIDWPAKVAFTRTLTLSVEDTDGITVTGSDVTIDLCGYGLVGPGRTAGAGGRGIASTFPSPKRLAIMNGRVQGWRGDGVAGPEGSRISDLVVKDCGEDGISVSDGSLVERCRVSDCGTGTDDDGIFANSNSIVKTCVVRSCTGDGIEVWHWTQVLECTAVFNGSTGIRVNWDGIVMRCNANSNQRGIFLSDRSLVQDSIASKNREYGIRVGSNCVVRGNVCSDNQDGESGTGIEATAVTFGVRIEENSCNSNWIGIDTELGTGHFVLKNFSQGNNTNYKGVIEPTTSNPWANR